ncbi:TRAP transporter substrate-binding protein [Bacillus salacetis]|uniref:TRAP transporter substrate-binding protein n=1 Tax=Bacillus salacetis TaxID=2315464 RepID=A0A3A1QQ47_9BACI|nr:TRAP transporter substrate-binding protein [Bacillus salacetis]RIW29182.1 TRAP transporter substrate-binding protein [Bacillus salacetis]
MKKIISLLTFMLLIGTVLAGCSGDDSASGDGGSDDKLVLKLGHIQSENDLWHDGALKFKEEVEKLSDGSIEVEIHPNSTLGGDRDMAEGMQIGTVDFALIAGVLGNFEKSIQLLELPYLFNSQEEYDKVVHGEVGQEIADKVLDASDIRILNWWDRGPRHVTSNKPINSLEDIQGLKIRLPEIKAMEVTWSEMGAAPTTMAWNEVYTGLEQNVIEAQENPIPFIYGGRIHEVQDYLALTAHKYEYVTLAMSDMTWSKLNDEQKEIIQKAADTATEYENGLVAEQTDEILEKMKSEGLQVTEPDTTEFAEAARKAHKDFAETVDIDLYNKIIQELE